MTLRLIITLFAAAAIIFSASSTLRAQEEQEPATHLWLYANTATVYVPASTKKGCEILVQQASLLNSSTGHCYLKEQFIEEIKCSKSLQAGGTPTCAMSKSSTR
jgi:hypothetical protein